MFVYSFENVQKSRFVDSIPKISYIADRNASYFQQRPHLLHSHPNLVELYLVLDGSSEITIDTICYPVRIGDLILINAGVLHDEFSNTVSDDLRICMCGLKSVHLCGLPCHHIISPDTVPVIPSGTQFSTLRHIILTLFFLIRSGLLLSSETAALLAASFFSIVLDLVEKTAPQLPPRSYSAQLTSNICQLIETSFHQPITLQTLSHSLSISPSYLSHSFKSNTGYSPMQYVMRRRIGEAQTLLMTTKEPITRIASAVGYDNASHFNATFSKHTGMSPGKFRKLSYSSSRNQ